MNQNTNPNLPDDAEEWVRKDSNLQAQLSSNQGVCTDMSSVALNGPFPAVEKGTKDSAKGTARLPETATGERSEPLTDAEIMLKVKDGDDAAFNYLIEKYRRPIVSFMYRMVHNSAIAEELAQEVFLRVYRSRAGYSAEAKFTTWLYRIATNLAVNHARDSKHDRPEVKLSLDEPDENTGLVIDVADGTLNVEQQILRRERLVAIRKQIETLPERQRMAVIMHKYQNMDYRQIAGVLQLSESATKSLLFRAYESLREKLKDFI